MHILIADDDPTTLLLLKNSLLDWDYDVTAVRDGNAAWEILRSADAPPLALLDWMMPGLSGVELCRKVRTESEAAFIYLVMLTGMTKSQDIIEGLESGADDYLSKPFEQLELRARLRAGQRIVDLHHALQIHATRDSLTSVWNRRMILEILGRETDRATRNGASVGVIMADLDHFKHINDDFGHPSGDAVLAEAAHRMTAMLRSYDSLGRYGGEEFLVILPECDQAGALVVADRIRQAVNGSAIVTPAGSISATVSLGVAIADDSRLDPVALLKRADQALYHAKRHGRNRTEVLTCV